MDGFINYCRSRLAVGETVEIELKDTARIDVEWSFISIYVDSEDGETVFLTDDEVKRLRDAFTAYLQYKKLI